MIIVLHDSVHKEKLCNVKLEPSTISLHQYDSTPLSVRGEITLTVQKADQNLLGRFVVVDNVRNQLPLLGRDWLQRVKLDWTRLFSGIQSINAVNVELIREEFPDVFKEELGMLKGLEAEIQLQPGVSPKFCKPCPIPFSLRTQVEGLILYYDGFFTILDCTCRYTKMDTVVFIILTHHVVITHVLC